MEWHQHPPLRPDAGRRGPPQQRIRREPLRSGIGRIGRVCVDAAGRNAVKEQVATVICGFAAQRSAVLKDRVLRYKIDFKSYNDALTVLEFMQNNL
ncbi:MAG TPA: hypothetical protein VKC66_01525 [Xanthobacteraceae bacterium]|nr:hypothetical protein [Xanthobacteraceae bacterium]